MGTFNTFITFFNKLLNSSPLKCSKIFILLYPLKGFIATKETNPEKEFYHAFGNVTTTVVPFPTILFISILA